MVRDFPFDKELVCQACNGVGAYDFYGDYLCEKCATAGIPKERILDSDQEFDESERTWGDA